MLGARPMQELLVLRARSEVFISSILISFDGWMAPRPPLVPNRGPRGHRVLEGLDRRNEGSSPSVRMDRGP